MEVLESGQLNRRAGLHSLGSAGAFRFARPLTPFARP